MSAHLLLSLRMRDGEWDVRIHGPHISSGQRHVHLRRRRKGSGEYSWNVDGTRHDEHRFPASEKDINSARAVAADHLGVPSSVLRLITIAPAPCTVTVLSGEDDLLTLLEARVRSDAVLLQAAEWLVLVELPKEDDPI